MTVTSKISVSLNRNWIGGDYLWRAILSSYSLRDTIDKNIILEKTHDSADAAIIHGEHEAGILFPHIRVYVSPSARLYVGREDLSEQWGKKRTGFATVVSVRSAPSEFNDNPLFKYVIRRYNSRPAVISEIICPGEHDHPFAALSEGVQIAQTIYPASVIVRSPVAKRMIANWLSK